MAEELRMEEARGAGSVASSIDMEILHQKSPLKLPGKYRHIFIKLAANRVIM